MEGRDVTPHGNVNDDRIVKAFRGVVFLELSAQSPGLAAHDGIDFRVIIWRAAEDEDTDRGLLQMARFSLQRGLDYEREELNEPMAAFHGVALSDPVEGVADHGAAQSRRQPLKGRRRHSRL